MNKLLLTITILAIIGIIESPAQTVPAGVKQIDALAKAIDTHKKGPKAAKLIFADVSNYDTDETGKWKKFASEKALKQHRDKSEAYTIAYLWVERGRPVSTNFTLFSPSGDWVKYVYSYYRADGSLARIESELRTFYGDYIGIRRQYFDAEGRSIRETVKFLDLKTRKPKKPSNEFLDSNPGWDKSEIFKNTSELPFIHLLNKR